jgi:hypothetical protein
VYCLDNQIWSRLGLRKLPKLIKFNDKKTTAWVALARNTDSIPNSMPNSMPSTEGQGATTAASLFGVCKEAVSDDDSVFIDL